MLFGIAYRMLGSAADAEDMVQEASIRWLRRGDEPVRSVRAYLVTVVTRLCIDQLESAHAKRVSYAGPWLPEPVVMDETSAVEQADSLSLAFLVLLEELTPLERAAYLLHDIFGYTFDEVATLARAVCARLSPACGAGAPAHRAATATLRRRPATRTGADRSFPGGVCERRPLGTARDALGGRRGVDRRRGQGARRRTAGGRSSSQLAVPAARRQEGRRRAACHHPQRTTGHRLHGRRRGGLGHGPRHHGGVHRGRSGGVEPGQARAT